MLLTLIDRVLVLVLKPKIHILHSKHFIGVKNNFIKQSLEFFFLYSNVESFVFNIVNMK